MMSTLINLKTKINNTYYDFFSSVTIFQACLEKYVFIPRFCYHVSLKISGNCRMCLIEEKSSIKPLASCAVNLLNGMTIYTNTETVKKAREGVLEYLLINHPLDCPICDQGGECDLQDQSMVFGSDKGRFYEKKRSTPNKNFGFLIKTFLNRCIHCSRCTRFLQEIAGDNTIQLLGRGKKMEISNYIYKFITSEISGNIIDLCPVGALTSKPSAYKARIWELTSIYTYDINDGFATNIQIDFRGLEIIRILPKINKQQNDEWISDKTRFFFDSINNQRLVSSFYFFKNINIKTNWLQNLTITKNYILNTYSNLKNQLPSLNYNFGAFLDFETAISLKFLQKKFLTSKKRCKNSLDFRENFYLDLGSITNFNNNSIKSVILFFLNLRFQSPILNIKIKKLANNFFVPIYLIGFLVNSNYDVNHIGTKIQKPIFNFILNQNLSTYFSSTFLAINKKTNVVADFISNLTSYEINLISSNRVNNFLNISCGIPENPIEYNSAMYSPFSIELLHHVNDKINKQHNKKFSKILYLPTKFYFEKVSNFVNNNFTFFDTSNHFSYTLPNTKEEWKTLFAIYDTIFYNPTLLNTNLFYTSLLQTFLTKFVLKNKDKFIKQKKT